uniref:Uncharacterized protein n=1 Tax=Anguilla anguilla TaxID=7936 RepID=A0A0E9W9F7_ANGAN
MENFSGVSFSEEHYMASFLKTCTDIAEPILARKSRWSSNSCMGRN